MMEDMFDNQKNMRFTGAGASHRNREAERTIKKVVIMASTIVLHCLLRFSVDILSTDILPMPIYYDVWIYNWIPNIQYGIYNIEIR